ncbi:MAG: NAD(+)/NADH kinase [Treponema sp.]|nr:NAD(+)/NADH kinase [Treponema sp.]
MEKVLIIINVSKDLSMSMAKDISSYLKKKNIQSDFLSYDGFCDNFACEGYDFVITLGGDGTVLYAARNCVDNNIPVFSVNLGQFGFISAVQQNEWQNALDLFLEGKAPFQERSMLKACLYRKNEKIMESYSLNDVVISAKNTARTICLDVSYNNAHLCQLKSDGVIISTPTGSTAYSASAGGPIVDPELNAYVLTPINSFSLSSRPVVLNAAGNLEVSVQPSRTKEMCVIVDGQEPVSLENGDLIKIVCNEKKIKLIHSTDERFYNALRSKLNWTGGPHA